MPKLPNKQKLKLNYSCLKHKLAMLCRSFLVGWLEVDYDQRCLRALINILGKKDEKTKIDDRQSPSNFKQK